MSVQKEKDMERVDYDLLEFDYYNYIYLYNGEPFTGIAYELSSDYPEGQPLCEIEFVDGSKKGFWRSWYETRQLEYEKYFLPDEVTIKQWNKGGQLILEEHSFGGVVATRKRWDDEGNLIEDYEISPEDSFYDNVQFLRNRKQ